jgi:hypothetical protein
MPIFEIETLEYFETKCLYFVEADTEEEAKQKVITGDAAYDEHEHPGNDDTFGEILSTNQQ